MSSWMASLGLILYFSSNYVDTHRLYNFGQIKAPRVPLPFLNYQSLGNCFLYNNCPVLPRDMVLKLLTNAHGAGAHHQSEAILHRLFELGHNHHRRPRTEDVAPTGLVYPQISKHDTPLSWPPQRRTYSENRLYPRKTTAASSLTQNSLFSNFLPNGGIKNKIPLADKNILRWQTTFNPEISPSDFMSVETTSKPTTVDPGNNTTWYNNSIPIVISNENVHSFFNEGSVTTPPIPILPLSETTLPTINTTALFYNVEIAVNTKSDEGSIKQNLTINAFTDVPKYLNRTINMFSINNLDGVGVENHTLSTLSQYKITSTKKVDHSLTSLSPKEIEAQRRKVLFDSYSDALDKLERKFYGVTFNKLTSTSPVERRENGISFVQSGLFLSLQLMAYSTEVDEETKAEIDQCLELNITDTEKIELIEELTSRLPKSTFDLKWRWSSRLVLSPTQNVSEEFRSGAASALNLTIGKFHGNETDEMLARTLNQMIEKDSGGAIRNTFDAEELSEGVRAVSLSTLYMRGRWRSAPTVLNGSRPFQDADGAPPRSVRMIRINDYVRYANFEAWNFQAIEIFYATRGLSLLMLVPNGRSLRELSGHIETLSIAEISRRLTGKRVAVTMPLYTLRMTLLLPSKLKALGVNKLISDQNTTDSGKLKLSHAIQRLMFWAEAGRNAFKDDGIEWDAEPELELVVDRPYMFFVRWYNITLMNDKYLLMMSWLEGSHSTRNCACAA